MTNSLDIKAKAPFPAGALSNLAAHEFIIDGIVCASMESFLQGLKVAVAAEQATFCALAGAEARGRGQRYDWKTTGTLWWLGNGIDRLSADYQSLLDRAYDALFEQSKKFRDALAATGVATLCHSLGKDDPTETILTTEEFISRLVRLRARTAPP